MIDDHIPTSPPPSTMLSRKPLTEKTVHQVDPDELPKPNIAKKMARRQTARKVAMIALLSFVFVTYVRLVSSDRSIPAPEAPSPDLVVDAPVPYLFPLQGYLNGIKAKGLRKSLGLAEGRSRHPTKYVDGEAILDAADSHHRHHSRKQHRISQKTAEDIFLSIPNNASAREYTEYAHPAGSGFDMVSALNLKNEWERALGLPTTGPLDALYEAGSSESQARVLSGMNKMGVWIDTYYPIMNDPVHASVTLLTDPPFEASLQEDIVEGDPDSVLRDAVKVFHGLSVSGDVTANYIYAGYGRKSDFDLLQAKGIDFTGKIALVKYEKVFRGLKVKAAQEAGAIGCIIFTDPGDDGEITEANGYEAYPNGPARQPSSIQRGSVQFISKYPGDPSTPGEPAYKNATRLEGPDGNQPSIPSLPISYKDAIPLLKALEGKGVLASEISADWEGGLGHYGVEYWTGPSEADLHFVNKVNTRVMPIWNTMATIPGHISDEVVIVGNHRDAWVLGGSDPNAGTAAQYELVRGLGKLLAKGWKPLRTIVLASWDAEEYGLIGSTEWTEDFGAWLKKDVVAYLNLDSATSGSHFNGAASPSLAWLVRQAASEINTDSDATMSMWDTKEVKDLDAEVETEDIEEFVVENAGTGIRPLGSGSDFTSFLQRYGVASGEFGYHGGAKDPVYHYHSIYDSFTWMEKFGDPGFHKHVDATKILGLMTLRLADSVVLPINTTQYAYELSYYLQKVENLAQITGFAEELDFTSLAKSIEGLQKASKALDDQVTKAVHRLHKLLPKPPHHGFFTRIAKFWWTIRSFCGSEKAQKKLEKLFELQHGDAHADSHDDHHHHEEHDSQHGEDGQVDGQLARRDIHRSPRHRMPPLKNIKEIKKVLEEIRSMNKKKQGFEGGFISEEGIKDRTWYKHKGVAPGKWLGYGATTFPALTEALTIDHSSELAQKEADELAEMIDAMIKRLKA